VSEGKKFTRTEQLDSCALPNITTIKVMKCLFRSWTSYKVEIRWIYITSLCFL